MHRGHTCAVLLVAQQEGNGTARYRLVASGLDEKAGSTGNGDHKDDRQKTFRFSYSSGPARPQGPENVGPRLGFFSYRDQKG